MSLELRLAAAFAACLTAALILTPLAIRLARRLAFYDQPNVDYKRHRPPTPYLGGTALTLAFAVSVAVAGSGVTRYWPLVVAVAAMWAVGTLDDRVGLTPLVRVAVEAALGLLLWDQGLGWHVGASSALSLLVTIVWLIGVVNAVNLLDNIDGSSSTIAGVCAIGIGILAAVRGHHAALAVLTVGMGGSCAGFLRYNLRSPARIFLGDGGSMPLGTLLAVGVMALSAENAIGPAGLLTGGLLVAIPILDTSLVLVSRRLRGVSFLTGGRDHTTHRLARVLGSPARVALVLGSTQAAVSAVAIAAAGADRAYTVTVAIAAAALGIAAIWTLERAPFWDGGESRPAEKLATAVTSVEQQI